MLTVKLAKRRRASVCLSKCKCHHIHRMCERVECFSLHVKQYIAVNGATRATSFVSCSLVAFVVVADVAGVVISQLTHILRSSANEKINKTRKIN